MAQQLKTMFHDSTAAQPIGDVSSGAVRVAWVCPCGAEIGGEDPDLARLCREEAIQRQFLRTSEQYLKGEINHMPLLGAWRRKRR
jgi:hypothetical protein